MLLYTMEIYSAAKKNEIWRKKNPGEPGKCDIKCGEQLRKSLRCFSLTCRPSLAHNVCMTNINKCRAGQAHKGRKETKAFILHWPRKKM